ncbi:hypothetical protein K1T71_013129 [Dendrolimus kikuchii]|uniref:Uncharacterized protein n=1 Tax=Dendrolimus kikuchii TaxID=765133 RepID=A0ACC1CJG2_9NEOP|nr:hypothetical protein K1T71_013129 [Dendrolimus kikuchii]
MKFVLVFTICLVFGAMILETEARSDDCFCTTDYKPVCGKDGITYSNACQMGCAGIEQAYEGQCEGSTS